VGRRFDFLYHKYNNFSKHNISRTQKEYGFISCSAIETHLWAYELAYQLQQLSGQSCVLKGGACAQLYLPLKVQRCTLDIDIATDLSSESLQDMLQHITDIFNKNNFFSSFRRCIPQSLTEDEILPMETYLFELPFIYKGGQYNDYADIKLDFMFSDLAQLSFHTLDNAETFGLKLKPSFICLTPKEVVSSKLLTLASGTIGLPPKKPENLYKNIYDLYFLINEKNHLESFKEIASQFPKTCRRELEMKSLIVSVDSIINSVLAQLYKLFTDDLLFTVPKLPRRVKAFEEKYIGEEVRKTLDLDNWAIMSMYVFIWCTALKEYINNNSFEALHLINTVMDNYDMYLTLDKNARRSLMRKYKKEIFNLDNRVILSRGINPLRIIYLYTILSNLNRRSYLQY
jgi:hypothetical protein